MRRGRPSSRNALKTLIHEILEKSQVPLNTSSVKNIMLKESKQHYSWNTIQKYINELVRADKVAAIQLPHSKIQNKTGVTVYTLKK